VRTKGKIIKRSHICRITSRQLQEGSTAGSAVGLVVSLFDVLSILLDLTSGLGGTAFGMVVHLLLSFNDLHGVKCDACMLVEC